MWKELIAALKALDFKHFNEILSGVDTLTLIKNPWTIIAMAIPCIIFVIRGMEKALVTFLSIPAILILFQKTTQGQNAMDFEGDRLFFFVLGFLAIAGVNIYFWIVRSKK
jgi:hypothetical protein